MKLLYFNDFRLGVLKGESVVDVTAVVQKIPHTGPGDLLNGLIARPSRPVRVPGRRHDRPGDRGLSKLTVRVRDDLKRTWARETRLEREQKGLAGTTPQLTGKYAPAGTRASTQR